eukprot:3293483-Pyramimonas_sp.AAC.1
MSLCWASQHLATVVAGAHPAAPKGGVLTKDATLAQLAEWIPVERHSDAPESPWKWRESRTWHESWMS